MTTSAETPSLTPTVTLVPGDGIVIRKPAFLCVLTTDAPAALLKDVTALQAAVAVPDRMPRRGRHLVRKLAEIVATADDPVNIAFAAPDSAGIAIFMSGAVFAEADGERLEPEGDEPFDRAVVWPFEGLGLYLVGAVPAEPGEESFDLVNGVVPARGALLHTPLGLRGTEIHEIAAPPPRIRPEVHVDDIASKPAAEPVDAESDESVPAFHEPPLDFSKPAPEPPVEEPVVQPDPVAPAPAVDAVDESMNSATEPMRAPTPPPPPPHPPQPEPRPGPVAVPEPQPFQSSSLGGGEPFQSASLGSAVPDPVAPEPISPEPVPQPLPVEPVRPAEPVPHAHVHHDDLHEPVEQRAPLPKQEHQRPATEVVKIEESRAHVHGIRCSRGHLNHPQSWLCGVCGIRMDQLTAILVEGERPPLGWLLLDNGSTYLLDEDLVIGREPGTGGGGGRGKPKPIRVQDESGQLSRRHVEIRLVEWTVQLVDLGSANGTYVVDPLSGNRETRLPAQRPHVLAPGSHVRIGGRHFIFESPHARV